MLLFTSGHNDSGSSTDSDMKKIGLIQLHNQVNESTALVELHSLERLNRGLTGLISEMDAILGNDYTDGIMNTLELREASSNELSIASTNESYSSTAMVIKGTEASCNGLGRTEKVHAVLCKADLSILCQ